MEQYALELLHEINLALQNIKKTPNREYRQKTIEEKIKQTDQLRDEFEALDLTDKNIIVIKREFDNTYEQLRKLLIQKLSMTTSDFKIDIAVKAIPTFNGNYRELDGFLTISKLLHESLNQLGKTDLLKFIYHVKLSSNVKTSLSNSTALTNFNEFEKNLKERYKSNLTLTVILNKLTCITQRSDTIDIYKEKLLHLISELSTKQIETLGNDVTQVQKDVINITNEKQALHIFKNGLRDNIKNIVISAQPKTLNEAINLAREIENDHSTNNTMNIRYIHKNNSNHQQNRQYYSQTNSRNYIHDKNRNNSYRNNNNWNTNTNNNYNNNRNSNNNYTFRNNQNNYNSNRNNNNDFNRNNHRNNYNNRIKQNDNNNNTRQIHVVNHHHQGNFFNNPDSQ